MREKEDQLSDLRGAYQVVVEKLDQAQLTEATLGQQVATLTRDNRGQQVELSNVREKAEALVKTLRSVHAENQALQEQANETITVLRQQSQEECQALHFTLEQTRASHAQEVQDLKQASALGMKQLAQEHESLQSTLHQQHLLVVQNLRQELGRLEKKSSCQRTEIASAKSNLEAQANEHERKEIQINHRIFSLESELGQKENISRRQHQDIQTLESRVERLETELRLGQESLERTMASHVSEREEMETTLHSIVIENQTCRERLKNMSCAITQELETQQSEFQRVQKTLEKDQLEERSQARVSIQALELETLKLTETLKAEKASNRELEQDRDILADQLDKTKAQMQLERQDRSKWASARMKLLGQMTAMVPPPVESNISKHSDLDLMNETIASMMARYKSSL